MVDVLTTGCVFIFFSDSEEDFALSLQFPNGLNWPDANFRRPKEEPLQKQLAKVAARFAPKPAKSKKRGAGQDFVPEQDAPILRLVAEDGSQISEETRGFDSWRLARFLSVDGSPALQLPVFANPPVVSGVRVPDAPVVGTPMVAEATLQNCELAECEWVWEASRTTGDDSPPGNHAVYLPSPADEGAKLRVWCRPPPPGFAVCSNFTKQSVRSAPQDDEKWAGLPRRAATCFRTFRAATYNVLADAYAGTIWAQENLFSYCAPGVIEAAGRRQLILRDILRIDADVFGLQEVDAGQLACLGPLGPLGWDHAYVRKVNNAPDGCALFWRRSRFQVEAPPFELRLCGAVGELPGLDASTAAAIESHDSTKRIFAQITTVAQGVLLRDLAADGKRLLVANTHLFYHPDANHIRLLQLHMLLTDLARRVEVVEADGFGQPALIVFGDLNARKGNFGLSDIGKPPQAAYRLFRDGVIFADDSDWLHSRNNTLFDEASRDPSEDVPRHDVCICCQGSGILVGYGVCPLCDGLPWDDDDDAASMDEQQVLRLELRLPLPLVDPNDHVEVTNFTGGFQECLDYTLLDSRELQRTRAIPAPSLELLRRETALPSTVFPSDHVPVITDVAYRS